MTDKQLAKHFGWWWKGDPLKALRGAFPEDAFPDCEEAIRKHVWPQLEQAAFNYEISSRCNNKGRGEWEYLLGKRFDRLSREQMLELMIRWPRKGQLRPAIRFLSYAEAAALDGHPVMQIYQLARKRARQDMETAEKSYTQCAGWTMLRYFTINLAQRNDKAIVEEFRKLVDAERKRLEIPNPPKNKGRTNRIAGGLPFNWIEALDKWNALPEEKRRYDRQVYEAQKEAYRLLCEWIKGRKGTGPRVTSY